MKANRFLPLLTHIRQNNLCGIDACSPAEVFHAISAGFSPEQISFTATSLSNQDLDQLSRLPGLLMNCDSLHVIQEWGKRCPNKSIGIRINPACGIGRTNNEKLHYSGKKVTKFGIYLEQLDAAIETAKEAGLIIERLHFHTGCGYLNEEMDSLEHILSLSKNFLEKLPDVKTVNIGGGLGVCHTAEDRPLDLSRWAKVLASHFKPLNLKLHVEPGDYIVKDAGILILDITYREKKADTWFMGVNAGFNIATEPANYGLPFEPVTVKEPKGNLLPYQIAGNINEALDIFHTGVMLPEDNSHTHLILLNSGAYSASMASNHCMRGQFSEYLLL
jgi:diaminopimelate decarboxylase